MNLKQEEEFEKALEEARSRTHDPGILPDSLEEAWRYFESLHGTESPLRTIDELRDKIGEEDLSYKYYEDFNPADWLKFWDSIFDSEDGWAFEQ